MQPCTLTEKMLHLFLFFSSTRVAHRPVFPVVHEHEAWHGVQAGEGQAVNCVAKVLYGFYSRQRILCKPVILCKL